jgi:hypothetical protein
MVGIFMRTGGPWVLEMPVTPLSAPEILVNAGAEERRSAYRGAREGRALDAVVPLREADDSRLDDSGAVNPADELRGMLRRLHGALNAIRVTQSSQTDIEDGLAFVNDKGVETGEGVSEGDEKVVKGTHWLILLLKPRTSPPSIVLRQCEVSRTVLARQRGVTARG